MAVLVGTPAPGGGGGLTPLPILAGSSGAEPFASYSTARHNHNFSFSTENFLFDFLSESLMSRAQCSVYRHVVGR